MAIDVQHSIEEDTADLNTTINTTPLVDVMLVLLVIFLVTVPVVVQNIPLQLPAYRNIVTETKPENIVIAVDRDENVYFNNAPVQIGQLTAMLIDRQKAVTNGIYPEVHVRGDKGVRFEAIGRVIFACQQAGIQKVGFITEPRAGAG
jgi:biopolymer transport protein ExbD